MVADIMPSPEQGMLTPDRSDVFFAELPPSRGSTAERSLSAPLLHPSVQRTDAFSLAFKTRRSLRWIVCLLILAGHALFIWGQSSDMWYLYFTVTSDVQVEATTPTAIGILTALGYSNPAKFNANYTTIINQFSYTDAVQNLWVAENIDENDKWITRIGAVTLVLFSGIWPHVKLVIIHVFWFVPFSEWTRTTWLYWAGTFGKWSLADVFVVCLLIGVLNLNLPFKAQALYETLNGQIPAFVKAVESASSRSEAEKYICKDLLKLECEDILSDFPCNFCRYAVTYVYEHPDKADGLIRNVLKGFSVSGDGLAVLRVAGLHGIYVYCFAVILSLIISTAVDTFDHKAKSRRKLAARKKAYYARVRQDEREREQLQIMSTTNSGINASSPPTDNVIELSPDSLLRAHEDTEDVLCEVGSSSVPLISQNRSVLVPDRASTTEAQAIEDIIILEGIDEWPANFAAPSANSPLLMDTNEPFHLEESQRCSGGSLLFSRVRHVFSWKHYMSLIGLSVFMLSATLASLFQPSLTRDAPGSVPNLINASFTHTYSIVSLSEVIAEHGGWDYFLQAVFALFIVIGPMLRGIALLIQLVVPGNDVFHRRTMVIVNVLGTFCALDVLLLAVVLINTEMPTITQTIISNDSFLCETLAHIAGNPNYCLEVHFNPLPQYLVVVMSGSGLAAVCSISTKLVFRGLDPYGDGDRGGPYCCTSCCGKWTMWTVSNSPSAAIRRMFNSPRWRPGSSR